MEPPILDKPKVKITPKITKISNLAQSAEEIKRTSTKLRKTFESGAYQKKTQLTVLNRYKKRLDSIQKQNDKRFLKKQRVKIKLPEIKKFAGSFFSAGSDPLKSIGALAAFNALSKGAKGDLGGAIGPALVAAGLFFGPALLKGGATLLKKPSATKTSPQIGLTGATAGSFGGTPYAQTRAGQSYAGMQQFRNLPKWAQRMSSSSASRFAASNERIIQGTANIGDRLRVGTRGMGMQGVGGVAENIATSKPSISPRVGLLNAALFGLDYMGRKSEGQTNLQAGVGAGAGVGGALIGAAIGSALFPGVGTLAGFLIGAAFSTGGALIASKLADTITGAGKPEQDKLKKQTEEQKKIVEKKQDKTLTFGKSLDRYERVVNKFEEFSKNFTLERKTEGFMENIPSRTPTPIADPYTGPISGETFIPLPGATSIGDPGQGQNYGAPRGGRPHEGIDLTELRQQDSRAPIVAYKTGKVIKVETGDIYPGGGIEIDHGGGLITRYLHVTPSVRVGDVVYGGQQIGNLFRYYRGNQEQTHLHFEVYQNNQLMNPTSYVTGVKNKITSPLTPDRAKQHHESTSKTSPAITPTPGSASPTPTPSSPSATSPSRVTSPSRPSRSISQYTSYDPRGQMEQVIPVPIPIPQQQMMQGEGSESMMLPGPSEQDLLNSFYKRVLLNTVA